MHSEHYNNRMCWGIRFLLLALVVFISFGSCGGNQASKPAVVPDQIDVTFKEGVTREEIDALNAGIGATVVSSHEPLQSYIMQFPENVSYEEASAFYEASDLVERQAPSVILYPAPH